MSSALGPRLVLVTRETEYDALMVRHATRGQADVFLRRRGQSVEGLDRQRTHLGAILAEIRAGLPKGWRLANVRRAELDRFLFAPEDVVVAVGQDGLVANLAKYLKGQPVIGVNGDPERNPGILVPHAPGDVAALLPLAAAGHVDTEARTMIRAELDDGQALLALNEVFVGHASHQSARYTIRFGEQEELQSSSGLIVATGTGATGWALSISRATGAAINVGPGEKAGLFLVREPWPSQATGAEIVSGRLGATDQLVIASRMNEGGIVFADGIEHDRLDFGWGRTLTVRVAEEQLRFVPGKAARQVAPPAPVRRTPRASMPTQRASKPAAKVVAPIVKATQPVRRRRLRLWYFAALAVVAIASRSCSQLLHAPDTAPSISGTP